VKTFQSTFPQATPITLGSTRMPDDCSAWTAHGLDLELEAALTTVDVPRQSPLPKGYSPLSGGAGSSL
jgi:hypothetical protein